MAIENSVSNDFLSTFLDDMSALIAAYPMCMGLHSFPK